MLCRRRTNLMCQAIMLTLSHCDAVVRFVAYAGGSVEVGEIACGPHMETGERLSVDQLERLREALVPYGLELLEPAWRGWNAQYRFRCGQGHELSRSGSQLLYKLVECPGCREDRALDRLVELARRAGGHCISQQYAGRTASYRFVCREGHAFEKTAINLLKGFWCVQCARARHAKSMTDHAGLKGLRAIAEARGGRCLSKKFTRLTDRYEFRCAEGHEWTTSGREVKRGAWCRMCANQHKVLAYRDPDGLQRLQQRAADRGGVCLASQYEGSKAYYPFRCHEGHEWETQGAKILRGAWCPECQHEALRFGIEMMHGIAAERRGRCLSTEYRNTSTRVEWECEHGHRWRAMPGAIVRGHWCPTCGHASLKLGIELMRSVAAERGGRCVSDVYVNVSTRLEWECHRGHRWLATPNTIRRGHWCARCHFIAITTNARTQRKRRHDTVGV